jgi:hypothetical protein
MNIKLISVLMILSFFGCKEKMDSNLEQEVIKVTLDGTELYQYKFADAIPVEGGYEIRKQAENHQTSEMNWGTYNYQAKEGFKGTETVEIVLTGSPGDGNFADYYKWILQISIK